MKALVPRHPKKEAGTREEPSKENLGLSLSPAGWEPCPRTFRTLTSEHVVILVDTVHLEAFIQLMQFLGFQHLPLPMGIACGKKTR